MGDKIYKQVKGLAMGSYHSKQIADLVLFLSEFNFLNNPIFNKPILFCRYVDGFMITYTQDTKHTIQNLSNYIQPKFQLLSAQTHTLLIS